MNIGRKDKNGKRYYTFKDIPKIHKLTEFFKYGFYIAFAIWLCEFIFVSLYNGSEVIKIIVTVILLGIHSLFVIGKVVIERKFGKEQRGVKTMDIINIEEMKCYTKVVTGVANEI